MTRRRAEFWILWLLPLLVMRQLLPTGVMPARGTHGVALVLCSSQHLRSAPDQGHAHADAPCPFAAAATGAAPAADLNQARVDCRLSLAPLALEGQCRGLTGSARSQRARAPPSFS
jgi:hypothetical protein